VLFVLFEPLGLTGAVEDKTLLPLFPLYSAHLQTAEDLLKSSGPMTYFRAENLLCISVAERGRTQ